ncbi:hypothetical protein AgCh_032173 [Apium graveolens]
MYTTVYVHHHGRFVHVPHCDYIGGLIDVVNDIDPDVFSFHDLEDYAREFDLEDVRESMSTRNVLTAMQSRSDGVQPRRPSRSPFVQPRSSVGYLPMRLEVSELENVNIKLRDNIEYKSIEPTKKMRKYFCQVTRMFPVLSSSRILTLELETIKALSIVSEFLVRSLPPFHNLIYVKVPPGKWYQELRFEVRDELGWRNVRGSIGMVEYVDGFADKVTCGMAVDVHRGSIHSDSRWKMDGIIAIVSMAKARANFDIVGIDLDELIPQMLPVSLNTQKLFPENLTVTPSDGQASSTKGSSDLGLWQGYMVKYEFIGVTPPNPGSEIRVVTSSISLNNIQS